LAGRKSEKPRSVNLGFSVACFEIQPYQQASPKMIPHPRTKGNGIQGIPVPFGAKFYGENADNLARLSFLLMLLTSATEERRDLGFFIPFPTEKWRIKFGGAADKVKKAARNHPEIFEFNDRYSNSQGNCFSQSIRLAEQFRTGRCETYLPSRRQKPITHLPDGALDSPSQTLVSHFRRFWLPESPPIFANAWQAFAWDRIAAGDFYAGRCDFGRFHSNFTAFRHRHLLQSDSPLVAVDVAACQMFVLGAVVRNAFGDSDDLRKWFSLCKTGELYDYIGGLTGKPRQEAKIGLIRCVFERVGMMTAMSEYSALEREFGAIARFLVFGKKNGHQEVARQCQRMESSILISKAVPRLSKIPMVTVHDEFIIPSEHSQTVQETIREEFLKHGMKPMLRVKELV
jgi:hypothetical protein